MTLYDDDADSFYSAESIDSIELLYLKATGFQLSDTDSDHKTEIVIDEEELKIEDPDPDKQPVKFVEDDFLYSLIDSPLPAIEEKSRESQSLESRDLEYQSVSNPQRKIKLPKLPSILPKIPSSIRISTLKRGFDKVKDRVKERVKETVKTMPQTKDTKRNGDASTNESASSSSITQKLDSLSLESEDIEYLLWHRYSLWENQWAHYLVDKITSKPYHIYLYICVSIAIFIADIEHSIEYRAPMDLIVDYIILGIFSLLMSDIILCCLVYRNYPFSFFWFLETLGTLTLLLDVNSIYSEKDRYQQNLFLTGRAGRTIHAIRIMALLRLSRIIQIIRITKLTKLAHIIRILRESFKINHPLSAKYSPRNSMARISTEIEHHAVRITSGVTIRFFEKIVIFLLVLLCMIPLLSGVSTERYRDIPLTKNVLINTIKNSNLKAHLNDIVHAFLLSAPNIFHLEIDGTIYKDNRLKHQHLRDPEIFQETGDYKLKMLVDISEYTRFEHSMNIGYSILVIVIFMIIIYVIIYAIDKVILEPMKGLFERIDTQIQLLSPAMLQSNFIEPMMDQIVGKTKEMVKDKVKNTMKRKLVNVGRNAIGGRLQRKSVFKQDETFKRLFSIIQK